MVNSESNYGCMEQTLLVCVLSVKSIITCISILETDQSLVLCTKWLSLWDGQHGKICNVMQQGSELRVVGGEGMGVDQKLVKL